MLSTIIVNYNTRRLTLELLQSLYEQVDQPDQEIIVIDNASSDSSARAISILYPNVRLVCLRKNIGFGRAVNLAAAKSSGEYIWLLNSDCRIKTDVVSSMIAYLESHPDTAIVTCRLVNEDGSFQASCRKFPTFGNILFSRQSPISMFFPSHDAYTLPDYTEPTTVESCSCTSTMIRRSCFDDVGGFDEQFFMYCEDIDLCQRFGERGWATVFLPSATVMHRWAKSWVGGSWIRFYHHHRSTCRYFRKQYSGNGIRLAAFEILLAMGVGIRAMLSLVRMRV